MAGRGIREKARIEEFGDISLRTPRNTQGCRTDDDDNDICAPD